MRHMRGMLAPSFCRASGGILRPARREPAQQAGAPPPAIRYESHLAAGGIAPAGGALRNPHQGDPAVAKSGALMFTAMNCDGCHGVMAADGSVPISQTDAGATGARMPRCSTQSTTVVKGHAGIRRHTGR